MKPFAPAEMRFSTAATWLSLSPSLLPANDWTEAPSFLACAVAPSFIFTKNGLVSVLVIRPSLTLSPPPPPPPPPSSSPQAAMPAVSASAEPSAARRDALRPRLCALIFPSPPVQSPSSENVYRQALNYACSGMSSVSENVLRRACEPRRPGTAMVGRHGRSRRRRRAVAPARHCLSSSPASSSPCGVGSPNPLDIDCAARPAARRIRRVLALTGGPAQRFRISRTPRRYHNAWRRLRYKGRRVRDAVPGARSLSTGSSGAAPAFATFAARTPTQRTFAQTPLEPCRCHLGR